MKETYYFSHDYNCREDEKIKNLIYEHSFLGYGIYWALIEMLYQNDGYMQTHSERIAFELRVEKSIVESVINDFNLFKTHKDLFFSKSVLHRIKLRKGKSLTAKKAAEIRWGKGKQSDANAMQTHSDSNAIKESKVKDIKVKENKVNKAEIIFPFDSKLFRENWELWKEYRKEINKPIKGKISEQSALKSLSKLSNLNQETAIKIIEQSISNNWQGLFELKNQNNGKQTTSDRISEAFRQVDELCK